MNKSILLNFYFFVLFIYTAVSSTRFYLSESSPSIIYPLIPFVLSMIVSYNQRISLMEKRLVIPLLVLTIWNIFQLKLYGRSPSPYPYIVIIVAYVGYHCYKYDFAERFVKMTVNLSIISLIVWGLCLISYDSVLSVAKLLGEPSMGVSQSLYIVNISLKTEGILRNAGFCWEPGRYSCILVIAIFFEVMRNGFSYRNKILIILLVAMASTMSTTGVSALLILFALIAITRKNINLLYVGGVCVIVAVVMSLPFMRQKMMSLWITDDYMHMIIHQLEWRSSHSSGEDFYCPQRFQGFLLQQMNLANMNLFIGDGRNLMNHFINRVQNYRIVISEGNLGIIVQYGILVGSLLYFYLVKSSIAISKVLKSSNRFIFLCLWIIINFSYSFWEAPLLAILCFWSMFSGEETYYQEEETYSE